MTGYPFKFHEIFKEKIWGGRRIETSLKKRLPAAAAVGESWELSDYRDDVSLIRNGPLEGKPFRDVWRANPEEILGTAVARRGYESFPLLVKFIDVAENVSVQVHPDDGYARRCDPAGDGGKTEAWYVLEAERDATVALGVRDGTTRAEFERRLEDRTVGECLNWLAVSPGEVVHLSTGTVHSAGGGILLCEIQQTSDATYRIWDWGRLGADGKPRPLHLEQAMDVIDFERGAVGAVAGRDISTLPVRRLMLDECEFFAIERIESDIAFKETLDGERFCILICIGGSGSLLYGGERYGFSLGDTVFLPAALGAVTVEPDASCTLLKTYVP